MKEYEFINKLVSAGFDGYDAWNIYYYCLNLPNGVNKLKRFIESEEREVICEWYVYHKKL